LGSVSRVNEVRINPLLKFEQVLWNSLGRRMAFLSC
jgi:hypothetical protein